MLVTFREKGKNVDEAIETLKFFFSSFNDKQISDETKKGGRRLHVVADDENSVKSSRVHAIVVNPNKKRVDVVFRGTTNVTPKNAWCDWSTNLKALWKVSQDMKTSSHQYNGKPIFTSRLILLLEFRESRRTLLLSSKTRCQRSICTEVSLGSCSANLD